MATSKEIDVLVLGEHPSAYLAAALLRQRSKLRISHACIPGENNPERLVLLNTALFKLHPLLEPLQRKIECRSIYGAQFLADQPGVQSEYRSKSALGGVACLKDLCSAIREVAAKQEVELLRPRTLVVHRVIEDGVEVSVGPDRIRTRAVVLAGRLPEEQERILGVPESWEAGVLHRYSFIRIPPNKLVNNEARPLVHMSLDLMGRTFWAWLLPGKKHAQAAVIQPVQTLRDLAPQQLLGHWLDVLRQRNVLSGDSRQHGEAAQGVDMALGGALVQEGVANRTLLIGPAAGFYSACGEDVYPNCWSAVYAADVLKKALRERHMQDELAPYRQKWRTTLGEYLRGPQQNLRFLLPLVYRNPIMTERLAESILLGKSLVR